jgi:hypothetical protein
LGIAIEDIARHFTIVIYISTIGDLVLPPITTEPFPLALLISPPLTLAPAPPAVLF